MKDLLKLLGAFVVSCFVMLDVNAMEEKQSQEGPEHKIGANCYFKVIKYPDFDRTCRTINIEVNYNGKKKEMIGIYMRMGFDSVDEGLSVWNIIKSLDKSYEEMPHNTKEEIARQCYADTRRCYYASFDNSSRI